MSEKIKNQMLKFPKHHMKTNSINIQSPWSTYVQWLKFMIYVITLHMFRC